MADPNAGPPYISHEKVRQLVTMGDLIEEVGRALQWFSDGQAEGGVVQPVRVALPVEQHQGYISMLGVDALISYVSFLLLLGFSL